MKLQKLSALLYRAYKVIALLLAMAFIISLKANAIDIYTVDTIPNPRLENTAFHVSDPDSLLLKDTVSYLNDKLTKLESSTGIQTAVIVLPSIGDKDVFDFSQELFRNWGIGHKDKNDGLLVAYIEDQHVIRFHSGYGLEGLLPDAICKRIQQKEMIPYFKQGKINEGMKAGIDAICLRLEDKDLSNATEETAKDNDNDDDDFFITFIAIISTVGLIFIVAMVVLFNDLYEKCPHCGKRRTLKTVKKKIKSKHHNPYLKVVKRCSNCGYEVVKKYDLDDDDDDHCHGGSGGSYSSSGSSFGGSFGGGSSGGGGASSRW